MNPAELSRKHEDSFVQTFINIERRERYSKQLASPKRRAQFLDRLNHRFLDDIDARFVVNGRPSSYEFDRDHLCYVISDESEFDARLVTLDVAEDILETAYFGTVVSYIPGKLAAYKDESPSSLLWLENFMTRPT